MALNQRQSVILPRTRFCTPRQIYSICQNSRPTYIIYQHPCIWKYSSVPKENEIIKNFSQWVNQLSMEKKERFLLLTTWAEVNKKKHFLAKLSLVCSAKHTSIQYTMSLLTGRVSGWVFLCEEKPNKAADILLCWLTCSDELHLWANVHYRTILATQTMATTLQPVLYWHWIIIDVLFATVTAQC